jgi:hypothetical protein
MTKQFKMAAGAALALALVTPGVAMAAPNFSGQWVRDRANSPAQAYPTVWTVRTPPQFPNGNNPAPFLVQIQQNGNTLQVTDNAHPQRTYVLDGKPHVAPADTKIVQATTIATVKDDTISVAITQPYSGMPGNVSTTETQIWSLSPDGKVLTISTVRESPAQRAAYAEVYTRR